MARYARNYLRVRGEYTSGANRVHFSTELPPRARRIRVVACAHTLNRGTTSACAENTLVGGGNILNAWNYLRVRGE